MLAISLACMSSMGLCSRMPVCMVIHALSLTETVSSRAGQPQAAACRRASCR